MHRWSSDDFDATLLASRSAGISVCVPALDEAPTVASVVAPLVAAREAGLVDQVLVADAGSSDQTARRARDAGADVVAVRELVPGAGPLRGKGDTVWRALHALDGDLLLFVDADLDDVDDRYVRGLAGPLLVEPEVQLVKAAFRRPLRGPQAVPYGGGRVTELTARPLLAALYPELAALAQPLGGQVGVRRDWLRGLPLWPDYGLEVGVLLETFKRAGTGAIAEVDIGTLLNRHQALGQLAGMASEVVHAILHELAAEGRLAAAPSGPAPLPPHAAARAAAPA